jgi:drug/metabolite transporter (DMT)-like permease
MLLMLVTGALNSILMKHQTKQNVPMASGAAPESFNHPYLQATLMMVGECLCLVVYLVTRTRDEIVASRRVPKWIFLIPCCCDWVATALICNAYAFIAVSVAQMCRGTVVIFTCLLSKVILQRRQQAYHLVGVGLVVVGITLVALSAFLNVGHGETQRLVVLGVSLCVFAQIAQAGMYVYEEKIMSQYTVQPLQVVGTEGFFGLIIGIAVLLVLQAAGVANTPGAFHQIGNSSLLCASVVGSIFSVAFFNFAGATVTQKSSAVARSTIKISSTILIWIAELAFGWNSFSFLQLAGFILVAGGTLLYNKIIVVPFLLPKEELKPILASSEGQKKADV